MGKVKRKTRRSSLSDYTYRAPDYIPPRARRIELKHKKESGITLTESEKRELRKLNKMAKERGWGEK